jgi:predicted transcriptional regulator
MTSTTSVKLPPELKERVAELARKTGRTPHSLIVEAVERHTFYEERMQEFIEEALQADAEMEATGEFYSLEDVSAWTEKLVRGEKAPPPKPCRR